GPKSASEGPPHRITASRPQAPLDCESSSALRFHPSISSNVGIRIKKILPLGINLAPMPPTVEKFVLKNGVRVLCESVSHVQSVAIGVWCQTGSRMEAKSEAGISHLIEHMLFKGTHKRSAKQIAESIEGRGGHLNAFTDREATCFYARVLRDDVQNAAE